MTFCYSKTFVVEQEHVKRPVLSTIACHLILNFAKFKNKTNKYITIKSASKTSIYFLIQSELSLYTLWYILTFCMSIAERFISSAFLRF